MANTDSGRRIHATRNDNEHSGTHPVWVKMMEGKPSYAGLMLSDEGAVALRDELNTLIESKASDPAQSDEDYVKQELYPAIGKAKIGIGSWRCCLHAAEGPSWGNVAPDMRLSNIRVLTEIKLGDDPRVLIDLRKDGHTIANNSFELTGFLGPASDWKIGDNGNASHNVWAYRVSMLQALEWVDGFLARLPEQDDPDYRGATDTPFPETLSLPDDVEVQIREAGDSCQRCGAGPLDLRTLWMAGMMAMDDGDLPVDRVAVLGTYCGSPEPLPGGVTGMPLWQVTDHEKRYHEFYTLRVCKDCRSAWYNAIDAWFKDETVDEDDDTPQSNGQNFSLKFRQLIIDRSLSFDGWKPFPNEGGAIEWRHQYSTKRAVTWPVFKDRPQIVVDIYCSGRGIIGQVILDVHGIMKTDNAFRSMSNYVTAMRRGWHKIERMLLEKHADDEDAGQPDDE